MNIKNNSRSQETQAKIETAFLKKLSKKNISKITVKELCEEVGITRSSFYGHYEDVYDLFKKIEKNTNDEVIHIFKTELYKHSSDFRVALIQTLRFIESNKLFYLYLLENSNEKSLFNEILIYDIFGPKEIDQDISKIIFFVGGLNALLLHWLQNDCKESPEEILDSLPKNYVNNI